MLRPATADFHPLKFLLAKRPILARRRFHWPVEHIALITLGVAVATGSAAGLIKTSVPAPYDSAGTRGFRAATTDELDLLMRVGGLDLPAIRNGQNTVPRLLLAQLPADFPHGEATIDPRTLFIGAVLPLVLEVNAEILADRRRLKRILAGHASTDVMDDRKTRWLADIGERYGADPRQREDLLRRVDAISPAVALAQAAQESGWGTSRFVHAGNALFGQRIWSRETGIVPSRARNATRFAVRAFPTLLDSVRAYALNLNRHQAYEGYRRLRAAARQQGRHVNVSQAAATLDGYSEEGAAYVQAIKAIIMDNSLADFEFVEIR